MHVCNRYSVASSAVWLIQLPSPRARHCISHTARDCHAMCYILHLIGRYVRCYDVSLRDNHY